MVSKPIYPVVKEHLFDQLTPVFPSVPVSFSGQSLISHAGVRVLTGFMDALGFGGLCQDRLGQFVPAGARHRPGKLSAMVEK